MPTLSSPNQAGKRSRRQLPKQAYDIRSFCHAYSISRSYAYLEIKAGRLKIFKAGRRTLISRASAERWQRTLEQV